MDRETRTRIQRAPQAARALLEREYAEPIEGHFDIWLDGTIFEQPGSHLDPTQRLLRAKLVAAVEHLRAGGLKNDEAVSGYLREAAFTTLNRFVALKMLEARGLVQECISRGAQWHGSNEGYTFFGFRGASGVGQPLKRGEASGYSFSSPPLPWIENRMSSSRSVAASLSPTTKKHLAIQALARMEPLSHVAAQQQVSRQFLHRQKRKAETALDQAFAPVKSDSDVLFHLPVTEAWISQLVLGLVLICHSSYRGAMELLRDLFDWPIALGTIHHRLAAAAEKVSVINAAPDLSSIRMGLHDEIFQGNRPVLAGVDAASTYCYLLVEAEHRDEATWGVHLLDAQAQGLNPNYTIADAGQGLRAGQRAALGETPCHGDVFHIQHQGETLANRLARRAQGATSRRQTLEQRKLLAKQEGRGNTLASALARARQAEQCALRLAKDIKTLTRWLRHDILALAGPSLTERQNLFDFIVAELRDRESIDPARIRPLRTALERQRDDLLGFARVLDEKLADIAERFQVPLYQVRAVCLLQRKKPSSAAYWQRRSQLHHQLSGRFHGVLDAVIVAMEETPRASSLVENLNSRLRNYFFLRRQLGPSYLNLLRFFLNHRTFLRSQYPERVGKSPRELMTGHGHPHWLELLGFERFRRAPIPV